MEQEQPNYEWIYGAEEHDATYMVDLEQLFDHEMDEYVASLSDFMEFEIVEGA